MNARDVMTPNVVTVLADAPVPEIATLLLERRISAVAVLERDGTVAGVVSEGDLIRRPELGTDRQRSRWLRILTSPDDEARDFVKTHGMHARDVMSRPVVSVTPEASLADIVDLMKRQHIKRVLVLDGGRLAGIVTRTDLLRALHAREALPSGAVPPDDRALREKILDALAAADWAAGAVVNVQVTGGQVEIWGAVDSEEQRQAIHVAVERIPGVRGITEHLARTRAG
jgi:CBS domain-containing protein